MLKVILRGKTILGIEIVINISVYLVSDKQGAGTVNHRISAIVASVDTGCVWSSIRNEKLPVRQLWLAVIASACGVMIRLKHVWLGSESPYYDRGDTRSAAIVRQVRRNGDKRRPKKLIGDARSLIRREEEQLVLLNWTADDIRRTHYGSDAGGLLVIVKEPLIGVEAGGLETLVNPAMIVVGA